jgi:hypothetical protein
MKKRCQLKALSEREINKTYKMQKARDTWDFYKEREFCEHLFNQRLNFLIIIYSLFLAGAVNADEPTLQMIVLLLGSVFTLILSLNLYRSYVKMIILLKILYCLEDFHVLPMIDKEVKGMGSRALFGVNHLTGIVLPVICVTSLLFGFFIVYLYSELSLVEILNNLLK